MLNTTAYLSLLTKEKEILMKMQSHKLNLKQMKSINRNEQQLKPVSINKNKTKYIKDRSQHQVDIENQKLTEKIEKIIKTQKKTNHYSANDKYSKSLNGHVKKTAQSKINQENLRLLQRLQHSKPTYSTKKYLQEFQRIKKVQKNMSSAEFYLTDSPRFRRRNLNTNKSFVSKRDFSVGSGSSLRGAENGLLVRQMIKLNDVKLWQIKILYSEESKKQGIKITGEIILGSQGKNDDQQQSQQSRSRDIKVINMPMNQANTFIAKHCQNKVDNIVNYLKVDQSDGSLIVALPKKNVSTHKNDINLPSPTKNFIPSPTKLVNPQEKRTNQVKLKKLQSLAGYQKKKAPSRQIFNTPQSKTVILNNMGQDNQSLQNKVQSAQKKQKDIKSEEKIIQKDKKQQNVVKNHQKPKSNKLLNEPIQKNQKKKQSVKSIKVADQISKNGQSQINIENKVQVENLKQSQSDKNNVIGLQSEIKNQKIVNQNQEKMNEQVIKQNEKPKQQVYDEQNFQQSANMKATQNQSTPIIFEKQQTMKLQVQQQKIEQIKQNQTNHQKLQEKIDQKQPEIENKQQILKEVDQVVQNVNNKEYNNNNKQQADAINKEEEVNNNNQIQEIVPENI